MKNILIVIFLMFSTISCKQEESNPVGSNTNSSKTMFPLAVGNVWTYTYTSYDSIGNITSQGYSIDTVLSDTTINSEKWYTFGRGSFYIAKEGGVWTMPPEELHFKYSANPGESYSASGQTVTVLSISKSVTVPAGTFQCIGYKFQFFPGSQSYAELYLGAGVGLVSNSFYSAKVSGEVYKLHSIELQSYTLH